MNILKSKRIVLIMALAISSIVSSCSQNVLLYEDTVHDWYKTIKTPTGQTLYETTKEVCWVSPRKGENYGYWTASYPWNKKKVIQAKGNTLIIYPGYAWDGMTVGKTTVKQMRPTLIHDALLHAYSNGVKVTRKQADNAFFDIMSEKQMGSRHLYYPLVRSLGWAFIEKGAPTLIIKMNRAK